MIYPGTWVVPLTGLVLLLAGACLWRAARAGFPVKRELLPALFVGPWTGIWIAGAVLFFWWLSRPVGLPFHGDPSGNLTSSTLDALGAIFIAALGTMLFTGQDIGLRAGLGALLWWTLALCAVTAVAPGAAFLLAWPLVFAWPAWLAAANTDEGSVATWVLTAPVVPLLVPVYLFLVQVGALSATGAISFAAVLLALTAPLVAPALCTMRAAPGVRAASALIGILLFVAGAITSALGG